MSVFRRKIHFTKRARGVLGSGLQGKNGAKKYLRCRDLEQRSECSTSYLRTPFRSDVEDLWEYGQKLDDTLETLCRMEFPRNYEHLRELFTRITHEQCDESWAHIKGLRKSGPQLINVRAIDREALRPRRGSRKKIPKGS